MSEFKPAVDFVVANEGGFDNDPSDPGGATNFGISLRFLREIPVDRLRKYGIFRVGEALQPEDIQALTLAQAELIYENEFWNHSHFEKIQNQQVCNYLFDMCVNHGIVQGIKIFQRALWAVYSHYLVVIDDGVLGDKTLDAYNTAHDSELMCALTAERAGYMRLIAQIQNKDKEFLDGWLNRCYRCS